MGLDQEEKFAQLKLIRSPKISNATFWSLINEYGSAQNAFKASNYIFCEDAIIHEEIEALKKIGGRFIFSDSELYPPNLKKISNPPPILSFLGNEESVIKLLKQPTLSVVGSRNATLNGMRFCFGLSSELANNGITIVSGLAKGIDTSAHKGSLSCGTIAILAGGVNYIYPQENKALYEQILKTGGVYSEMPYNTYPTAGLFPRRNGIIAGMADGTLIVEAARKSGSLITATLAKKFNRHIFAVPNSPLDVRSQGTNDLIKKGATVVTCAGDVLNQLFNQQLFDEHEINTTDFCYKTEKVNDVKGAILKLIDTYSLKTDELINCIDAPAKLVSQAIIELEIAGKIKRTLAGEIVYTGH